MKRTVVVVTLRGRDLLELEEICLDEDARAALRFLKERVKPQVDRSQTALCDPDLEARRSAGARRGGETAGRDPPEGRKR